MAMYSDIEFLIILSQILTKFIRECPVSLLISMTQFMYHHKTCVNNFFLLIFEIKIFKHFLKKLFLNKIIFYANPPKKKRVQSRANSIIFSRNEICSFSW